MQPIDGTVRDYLAALSGGTPPRRLQKGFEAGGVLLSFGEARRLRASGILDKDGAPTTLTRAWLKANGHGEAAPERREGVLARLGCGADPFLAPHQMMAGQRLERLCERGRLRGRVTMAYAPVPTGGTAAGRVDLDDTAIDARRRLRQLLDALPGDCANILIDVCGFGRGLEEIERERRWPRRSAKLVLRIGLDQLARQLGLDADARGPGEGRTTQWGDRPTEIG